ncbi:MAG: Fur family transcriptional regulator [Planctomycetota bacterium]
MSVVPFEQATEVFRRFLRAKDLKITRQREILLRRIFESAEHFSAETLEDRVKGDGISKATIYRTLQLLLEAELIAEASLEDDRRFYEHIFGRMPHDHIVCIDCRKVFEFDGSKLAAIEGNIAADMGFVPVSRLLRLEANCIALRETGHCEKKEIKLH